MRVHPGRAHAAACMRMRTPLQQLSKHLQNQHCSTTLPLPASVHRHCACVQAACMRALVFKCTHPPWHG